MLYAFSNDKHLYLRREGGEDKVRAIAHPCQYAFLAQQFPKQVEVCSVSLLSGEHFKDPDEVLNDMANIKYVPPASGGWHKLTLAEINALKLANYDVISEFKNISDTFKADIEQHPIITAGVGFAFDNEVTLPLVVMMKDIFDIRRFADPSKPKQDGKLKAYYRLVSPRVVFDLLCGIDNKQVDRAAVAVSSWYVTSRPSLDRDRAISSPREFLARDYFVNLDRFSVDNESSIAHALSIWKTTIRFLVFVRQLWLSEISGEPFKPERFFHREDEVEAFLSYRRDIAKETSDA